MTVRRAHLCRKPTRSEPWDRTRPRSPDLVSSRDAPRPDAPPTLGTLEPDLPSVDAHRSNRQHGTAVQLRTFVDMFCGIGGFHVAASNRDMNAVFACEIDPVAREWYECNFGIEPAGDIAQVNAQDVPDHDVLFAGFPCQPFSVIGNQKGMADARGTLFGHVERIVNVKRPRALVLENVPQFVTNRQGEAFKWVLGTLERLGYHVHWKILNALHFGLPQNRRRVFIVAIDKPTQGGFPWPADPLPMLPLAELLESAPDPKHFASRAIRESRHTKHRAAVQPAIWHENKSGNVSSHPFSCALRAGASYNYLLVDGQRRLTEREMFRLQGFPDSFTIPNKVSVARRLTGNAVAVPVVEAVVESLEAAYRGPPVANYRHARSWSASPRFSAQWASRTAGS